jgi:hypothetical protein
MVFTRHASRLAEINQENASNKHHDTPKKARVKAAYEELKLHEFTGARDTNNSLFQRLDIPKRSGYRILAQQADRTHHNQPGIDEARGRPKLITPQDLARLDTIIQSCGVQGRSMTWETLAYEADLDVSVDTIRRAMGTLDYHKCIACRKTWISDDLRKRRKKWAAFMLNRYPDKEDWKHIRFSDKVHLSLGPQNRLLIIRRKGERYCPSCIQTNHPQKNIDKKKVHA